MVKMQLAVSAELDQWTKHWRLRLTGGCKGDRGVRARGREDRKLGFGRIEQLA